MKFKEFLIETINNPENEADVILHQIISNVDESHVYYSDHRLDFNIGIMIKRSAYFRLYMSIFNGGSGSIKLGKNKDTEKGGYTIVISAAKYPDRMDIDAFLSQKGVYDEVKEELVKFIENYKEDVDEFKKKLKSIKM
jgi:hypothetical protein